MNFVYTLMFGLLNFLHTLYKIALKNLDFLR